MSLKANEMDSAKSVFCLSWKTHHKNIVRNYWVPLEIAVCHKQMSHVSGLFDECPNRFGFRTLLLRKNVYILRGVARQNRPVPSLGK